MLVLPDNFNGFCHFSRYFDKTVTRMLQIVARFIGWIKELKNAQDMSYLIMDGSIQCSYIQLIKCLLVSPLIGIVEPSN